MCGGTSQPVVYQTHQHIAEKTQSFKPTHIHASKQTKNPTHKIQVTTKHSNLAYFSVETVLKALWQHCTP